MVEKQDFEALIVRYLEGVATPEEAMLLEDWKAQSDENQQQFDHYERLFAQNRWTKVDVDAAWKKVNKDISTKTKVIPLKDWRYWAVAAAAILVLALVLPTLMTDSSGTIIDPPSVVSSKEESNTLHATNGVKSYILDDSSVVALKSGSSLELNENFKNGNRRAKLKGSGRFTVVHDEQHPFVIDVEGLEVYDIGTVFDITTNKDTVKVVVLEGAVELRKNGKILAMEEGDSAFYLISQQLIKEYPTPKSLKGITIEFENTPLKDIVSHLSKFFKRNMVIKDEALKEEPFNLPLKDAEFPEVIKLLKSNQLRIENNNGTIEIYDGK